MKNLLSALDMGGVIGTINPPVDNELYKGDVNASLGKLIATGIQIFFFIAALAALLPVLMRWANPNDPAFGRSKEGK